MKEAGAAVPSPNRITLLRDADGDGVAETRTVFLQGLTSPFGIVLVGNELYVANTDAVVRFPYRNGETAITTHLTSLFDDCTATSEIYVPTPDGVREPRNRRVTIVLAQ